MNSKRSSVPTVCGMAAALSMLALGACGRGEKVTPDPASQAHPLHAATGQPLTVAVVKVTRGALERQLTVSSELIPFQEIDVYAKEAGYVKQLLVDYGSHVSAGQLLAVLEIPELQAQLAQDQAAIKSVEDQVTNAQHQLDRLQAEHKVTHLQYERLSGVAQSRPGLVAQQEVDELQGRDLASEAQVEAGNSNLLAARSNLVEAQAKLSRDQAIYSYARITAPFNGVVTQRYANLGTLLQAGTNSSTQAMPLVKLSEEDRYRLVIPVPEGYVSYIGIGDPVEIHVPTLDKTFEGRVARFSTDVVDQTRTMHTEVDVPNPSGALLPGVYAEATISLNRTREGLIVPLEAIDQGANGASVMLVDSGHTIRLRPVTIGIQTETSAEVQRGLREGDLVVVSDRAGLRPGEQVNPQVTAPTSYENKS